MCAYFPTGMLVACGKNVHPDPEGSVKVRISPKEKKSQVIIGFLRNTGTDPLTPLKKLLDSHCKMNTWLNKRKKVVSSMKQISAHASDVYCNEFGKIMFHTRHEK